ncbi:hypothetical protein BH23ACT9_BH23ACT9_35420 [soil metagenome]
MQGEGGAVDDTLAQALTRADSQQELRDAVDRHGADGPLLRALAGAHTDRIAAQQQVRALQQDADEVQSLAQVGSFVWEVATDRIDWSGEMHRIHGQEAQHDPLTYDQVIGRIHPDDRQRVKEGHLDALATGEPYFMTERVIGADGDVRVLDTSALVVLDDDGQPAHLRGVSVDMTSRARVEDTLRHSVAKVAALADDAGVMEVGLHNARMRRRQPCRSTTTSSRG